MKAIVCSRYGPPDVLELSELDPPDVGEHDVLVRVRAASVNPADWYGMTGTPYVARIGQGLRRPKSPRVGFDFAGVVEAVGSRVTHFKPGDEVFGGMGGALAEYVSVTEERSIVAKPANLSFEQAAAVPVAALTALQGLRDQGHIEHENEVLINGASGGVGTFAVQLAKWFGAAVTGVCSTRNVDMVRSLGADTAIDYTQEDFTRSGRRFDLVLDVAGSRSWSDLKRVMTPSATLVIIGGPKASRMLGPLAHVIRMTLASLPAPQKSTFFIAKMNKQDLEFVSERLGAGEVTPVVERTYPLSAVADAFRYLGEGHARGKIVITL